MTALAAAALAGCGNSRTTVQSLTTPAGPNAFRTLSYPAAGIRFSAPSDWQTIHERAPLVTVLSSGDAIVAVWRYQRSQPLPATRTQLRRARTRLIAAARAHDPGLELLGSSVSVRGGVGSIVLSVIERIGSEQRRVRSTHLFGYGQEIVLEEYAPPAQFRQVDREVFSHLAHSFAVFPATAA